MRIRPESSGDVEAIASLITAAFAETSFSAGREAACLAKLRADGDLKISLVATDAEDRVIGCIAFSPVFVDGQADGWFGLGPVAVRPDRQGRGVGRLLIERGLADLERLGARGCALIGKPALYGRFGFSGDRGLSYRNLPPAYVQQRVFDGGFARGVLTFSPGLETPAASA